MQQQIRVTCESAKKSVNSNISSTSHVSVPLRNTTTTTSTTEAKSHINIEPNATHHHNRPKNRKVRKLFTYGILGGTTSFTSYTQPLIPHFEQFYHNIIYNTIERSFPSRLVTRAVTTILNIIF